MENDALLQKRVSEIVGPYVPKRRNLSVVVGVVRNGVHQVFGYGPLTALNVPPADLIFEIGSITKVFTGLLLAQVVGDGLVGLEDPIRLHLPPEVRVPSYQGQEIKLVHLSTHTAGLPRVPKNLKSPFLNRTNPYAFYTVTQLYDFLSGYQLRHSIPAPVTYSNLGVGLLGHILARVLGVSYEEAIRQRICAPLGLDNTVITLSPPQQKRLVHGHSACGRLVPNWDLPTLAGAGALRSTASDLLAFLAANMGQLRTELAGSIALSQMAYANRRQGAVGLGWMLSPFLGHRLVWHNGGTGGYNSFAGFVHEKGVGVCVLTNQSVPLRTHLGWGKPQADDIGVRLLKDLLIQH